MAKVLTQDEALRIASNKSECERFIENAVEAR
jgi:hypothetical protein